MVKKYGPDLRLQTKKNVPPAHQTSVTKLQSGEDNWKNTK